jgi:N-acetylneuraminic acid mutarotase
LKKISILFFLLSINIKISFAQEGYWNVISTMPTPVKNCQAVVIDSLIYIIGGFSDTKQEGTDLVQSYNPETNTWKNAGIISTSRYGLIAKNYHDSLLIFGGSTSDSLGSDYIEFWNRVSNSIKYSSNINFNRTFSTSEIYNDNLYIFGGYASKLYSDTTKLPYIVEYNIPQEKVTYTDTTLYNDVKPILQMSVLVNDEIYIFGGVKYGITKEVFKFNTSTHKYEQIFPDLMQARAGGVAIYDGMENIYIIGGSNESTLSLSSMEIFTLYPTGAVNRMAPELNFPRTEFAAVKYKNSIYVFGGKNSLEQIVPEVEVFFQGSATAIKDFQQYTNKADFELNANYPNPFNSSTTINYRLYKPGIVKVKVFNLLGYEIKTLVNENKPAGFHKVLFDASSLASGFYIVQLTVNTNSTFNKILLLK